MTLNKRRDLALLLEQERMAWLAEDPVLCAVFGAQIDSLVDLREVFCSYEGKIDQLSLELDNLTTQNAELRARLQDAEELLSWANPEGT